MADESVGHIVQVLGNVVDVEFTPETLPEINTALTVAVRGGASGKSNGHANGIDRWARARSGRR